jgi:hypothetical protein
VTHATRLDVSPYLRIRTYCPGELGTAQHETGAAGRGILETNNDDEPHRPLLTAHAALVLLLSLLSGIGAAVLTALSGRSVYEAILIGLGTTAVAVKFFHWLIQ